MKHGTLRWLNIAFAMIILISVGKIFAAHLSQPAIGTAGLPDKLHIDGVGWSHDKNVVLFLQTTCTYCHQSETFHAELAELAKSNGWGIVSVFPESTAMAKIALENAGIDSPVVEADLSALGVEGTPTLAIVDSNGKVQRAWAGLIDEARKREVFSALGLLPELAVTGKKRRTGNLPIEMLSIAEAGELLNESRTVLLDIRPRDNYRASHLTGAINIPRDELETRAPHELDKARKIVVFCQYLPDCEKASEEAGLMTNCTIGTMYLQNAGFNVALLQSDIRAVARNGYALTRGNPKESK